LEIPRGAKHLVMELPIGSREGIYEVALLDSSDKANTPDGPIALLSTTGTAQLENHTMLLRADVDLERISPGTYLLGVRQPDLEWTRLPIRVH
jgi:hypothetical protein